MDFGRFGEMKPIGDQFSGSEPRSGMEGGVPELSLLLTNTKRSSRTYDSSPGGFSFNTEG